MRIKYWYIYFVLYIYHVIGMVNPHEYNKRRLEQDFEQSKKICMPQEPLSLKGDLLAQIFSARVSKNKWFQSGYADISEYDAMLVTHALSCVYVPNSNYDQSMQIEMIKHISNSDVHHCLVHFLISNNALEKKQKQHFLDECFLHCFKNRAFINAEFFLKNGASAHIALPKFDDDMQSVCYYGVSQLAYKGDLNRLRLLLRFGASMNIAHFDENPLVNALQNETRLQTRAINMLLYYGADPKLPLKSYHKKRKFGATPLDFSRNLCVIYPRSKILDQCYKLCRDGHACRTYRMANYLHRIIKFPTDLCYIIAEYLYGRKLDFNDRSLFAKFKSDDYKINRSIIK